MNSPIAANASVMRPSGVARMPVWVFAAGGLRLMSSPPLEVVVQREGPDAESPAAAFVFSCPVLHVFAAGDTYKSAEDSFHEQVVHFYQSYLNADPNELTEDAAELQKLYRNSFQESA